MKHEFRKLVVCLIPRFICSWLWRCDLVLGDWAPYVFGRVIGRDPEPVKFKEARHV